MSIMLMCLFMAIAHATAPGVGAADWTLGTNAILSSASHPSVVNGVGRPSVEYHHGTGQFVMVLESRSGVHADCDAGVWSLRIARSTDNITWTLDPMPLLAPVPSDDTYYNCVAAHPAVMWSDDSHDATAGDDLRVYFKAGQSSTACDTEVPPWGCSPYTGIGDLLVELDLSVPLGSNSVENVDPAPVPDWLNDLEFGYPSVAERRDGRLVMMYEQRGMDAGRRWDLYVISSYTERGGWGTNYKVLQPDSTRAWAETEYYTPALLCMPDRTLAGFVGGRTHSANGGITSSGWSTLTGLDAVAAGWTTVEGYNWTNAAAAQQTGGADDWRHLAALRVDADEYLIWYTKLDSNDNPEIWTGSTTGDPSIFTPANIVSNRCR